MSDSTLHNVVKSLVNKYNLNPHQVKQIERMCKHWSIGFKVYPGEIKSIMDLDINMTYKLLKYLEDKGFLEKRYELYCSKCHNFKEKVLKTLTDDLSEYRCDFCKHEFTIFKDTIMIFEVVN